MSLQSLESQVCVCSFFGKCVFYVTVKVSGRGHMRIRWCFCVFTFPCALDLSVFSSVTWFLSLIFPFFVQCNDYVTLWEIFRQICNCVCAFYYPRRYHLHI